MSAWRSAGRGTPIEGVVQPDGKIVAEGVLVGSTWTAKVSLLSGEGRWMLFVDSARPRTLHGPTEKLTTSLEAERTRAGFVFASRRPTTARITVASDDPGHATPGLGLRDAGGGLWDAVPPGGTGQVESAIPKGSYVIEVQGEPGQAFTLSFVLDDTGMGVTEEPAPPSTSEPTQGPDAPPNVAVPDVSMEPATAAALELAAAGFVVETVPVCSNSLFAQGAEVGTTRQVVLAGASSVHDEVEVVGKAGVTTPELPRGSSVVLKSFSGLACP